ERIRPSTQLKDLMPLKSRYDQWRAVENRVGQPLPPFADSRKPTVVWVVTAVGILALYAVGVPAVQAIDAYAIARGFEKAWWFRVLGLLVPTTFVLGMALVVGLAMYLFRRRIHWCLDSQYATVGSLAGYLARTAEMDEIAVQ